MGKTNRKTNKIKSQTHHNQSRAVTERINECKNKYKNKKQLQVWYELKRQKYINLSSNQPPLTIQDTKQNKQSRYTSTIPTHTHHCPHYDRPLTPHQEFKISLTPGVLKRNRLDLIGSPVECWF